MKAAPTLDTRGGGSQLPSSGNWGWLANLPETETETETETCAFQFLVLFGHSLPTLVLR